MRVLKTRVFSLGELSRGVFMERSFFLVDLGRICKIRQATFWKKEVKVLVTQSCPILCNPMNCSPPGSPVHGDFQARILEWVPIPFSRGSSRPRD